MVTTATAGASTADEDRVQATASLLYDAECALHVAHQTTSTRGLPPPAIDCNRRSPTTSRPPKSATRRLR